MYNKDLYELMEGGPDAKRPKLLWPRFRRSVNPCAKRILPTTLCKALQCHNVSGKCQTPALRRMLLLVFSSKVIFKKVVFRVEHIVVVAVVVVVSRRLVVTDVSKVSSWRAVQKLIEEVPTSFGGFVANYFSSQ